MIVANRLLLIANLFFRTPGLPDFRTCSVIWLMITKIFRDFFESEKSGGFILIGCTALSMILANTSWGMEYISFWHHNIGGHSIEHWINDGLMTIFFLMIGLELEREIYKGELSEIKNALLPAIAAVGGMLVPAGIYLLFNYGTPSSNGAGIPMATDIAFAIGILSLLGNKVPLALKVFLTALAVIDDLGAILIIAFFYSKGIVLINLAIALGIFFFLLVLNRFKVYILWIYLIAGVVMWYFMLQSGVHATITGVLLAFAIPFGNGDENSISYKLQHFLHRPVSFIILPLFAFANTCILIQSGWMEELSSATSIGIIAGLALGKPIGVLLFSFVAIKTRISVMPLNVKWVHLAGAGLLAGIGFTMSIFITLIAFTDPQQITDAKIATLIASLISSIAGFALLSATGKVREREF